LSQTLLLLVVLLLSSARFASAKDHLFFGVGAVTGQDDAANRVTLPNPFKDDGSYEFVVDGGVWLTSRVAVGVEWLHPPDLRGGYGGVAGSFSQAEHASTVVGTVRVRAWTLSRVAIDVLGGAGTLQRTVDASSRTSFECAFNPSCVTTTSHGESSSLAWVVGVDVPVRVVRYIALVPAVRIYSFQRPPLAVPQDLSSTRAVLYALVRVHW
jgi:hypothetical protein